MKKITNTEIFEEMIKVVTGLKFRTVVTKAALTSLIENFNTLTLKEKKLVLAQLSTFKTFKVSEINNIVNFVKTIDKKDLDLYIASVFAVKVKSDLTFRLFRNYKHNGKTYKILEKIFWTKNYWGTTVAANTVYIYNSKSKEFEESFTYAEDPFIWASYKKAAKNYNNYIVEACNSLAA